MPVGETVAVQSHGTSTSVVSRRFINATVERLAELLSRPRGRQRWRICLHDAFGLGEHTMVATLGVTADGNKVPLGVAEGSTGHAAVAIWLFADLAARCLDAEKGVLFLTQRSACVAAKDMGDVHVG